MRGLLHGLLEVLWLRVVLLLGLLLGRLVHLRLVLRLVVFERKRVQGSLLRHRFHTQYNILAASSPH